jgi:hypothetical protein
MTDLSPQAQAVLDAADSAFDQAGTTRQGIAAALRAAADQVITDHRLDFLNNERDSVSRLFLVYVREQFRAIAAELEGADD